MANDSDAVDLMNENTRLKELLVETLQALILLDKAVANLLPGARHIAADVGLINNALLDGAQARLEITKVLGR